MTAAHPEAELLQDLVDANHILYHQGIVDAFGHVSARSRLDPQRFYLARNVAPGLVTAADVLAYDVERGEPVADGAPRQYLERYIHSEILRARPDVMAVVHNHSPAVLPFGIAQGAQLRPACHMCGFLADADGAGPPLFEIRDSAGHGSDLLIRSRELGASLARCLGQRRAVLMRGHGITLVGENVRIATYRAIYAEANARLLLQAAPLGALNTLTAAEAEAARIACEGQVDRPWQLWRQQAQAAAARAA